MLKIVSLVLGFGNILFFDLVADYKGIFDENSHEIYTFLKYVLYFNKTNLQINDFYSFGNS